MKFIIEEYTYTTPEAISIISKLEMTAQDMAVSKTSFVGYCYSQELNDCVFFLPKVILDGDKILGKYDPELLVDFDSALLDICDRRFLYEFALWIYRALDEYKKYNQLSDNVRKSFFSVVDSTKHSQNSTFVDVALSIKKFCLENQNNFVFTIKESHCGNNRINWNKTVAKKQPVFSNKKPIYLQVVNRLKQVDFDEELLTIFYSIVYHLNRAYGFSLPINCNYKLITGALFDNYLKGQGLMRLRSIKSKYFKDSALKMWRLCEAYFSKAVFIQSSNKQQDYLLAKDFNPIFESMVEDLLGEKDLPKDLLTLKNQKDGKIVDHIYPYHSLVSPEDIYYIGDSKYYSIDSRVDGKSEYKQYTYAKNVIQFNLDLLFQQQLGKKLGTTRIKYRDELTEGYNITPNFFISSKIKADQLNYSSHNLEHIIGSDKPKFHFRNRLFDRDTLWLSRYNINFLFVVSLYACNNYCTKNKFKEEARTMFRREIIQLLNENYSFYLLKEKRGIKVEDAINSNFRLLSGKIFQPEEGVLILALENPDADKKHKDGTIEAEIQQENKKVVDIVDSLFDKQDFILS